MSKGWRYVAGDWNAVCDSCGRKFKASQLRKRWDGMMVCSADFEIRHPQDFIKSRQDQISVPWSRPQLPLVFPPLLEYISDNFSPINESIELSSGYYRYIGVANPGLTDPDVVNGSVLNLNVLNYTSVDPPTPGSLETVTLTEAVVTYLGSNQDLSDGFTISEAVIEGEAEFPTDSVAYSEVVSTVIVTNRILNGHTVNGVLLG